MIHLSYNGELYSYDNKTTTTVSSVTNIPITIHPYEDIEGAKLYYKQNDTEGIVDITNNEAEIPGAYLVTGDLQIALKLASSEMSNYFTINVIKVNSSGDVTDDDIQFTMDNKKRLILVPGSQSILAVQLDNQSEIVTFKFPRYQEEVDLSTKIPYVNYKRPQAEDLGKALCTIEKTDDTFIYFSWMIDATATQYSGTLQFQVEFTDSEGYRWQSQIGELPILTSLYNTGLEPYIPSILEQYLEQIQQYSASAEESAQEAQEIADSIAGKGLTEAIKQALLQLAQKVAYIDDQGQTYYNALYNALYPPANLVSISAVFTQGDHTIYDTDELDTLKQYLVVTAAYDDQTMQTVTGYTLSGTLAEGTSVITVSYGGKTATFNVTVTHDTKPNYNLDALDGVQWIDDYKYNDSTGVLEPYTGEHVTEKFTAQDCLYRFQAGSADKYVRIYVWKANGSFLRYDQSQGNVPSQNACYQFKPGYQYALKVFNESSFDSSAVTMMPVNNSLSGVQQFSMRLKDFKDSFTKTGAGIEFDATNFFNSHGVYTPLMEINRISEPGGMQITAYKLDVLTVSVFTNPSSIVVILNAPNVSTVDRMQTYIDSMDPTVVFNY